MVIHHLQHLSVIELVSIFTIRPAKIYSYIHILITVIHNANSWNFYMLLLHNNACLKENQHFNLRFLQRRAGHTRNILESLQV